MSLGVFPCITLKQARIKRDDSRRMLDQGNDPAVVRKAERAARSGQDSKSFEGVAREWYAKFFPNWAPTHADKILRRLERDVFPFLGSRPVRQIAAAELLVAARRIENRGALETGHRALQNCGQVFRYAVAIGRAERNPVADLKGALPPPKEKYHASITEPKAIGPLLRAVHDYQGNTGSGRRSAWSVPHPRTNPMIAGVSSHVYNYKTLYTSGF